MHFEQVKNTCGESWCMSEGILQTEHYEKPASSKKVAHFMCLEHEIFQDNNTYFNFIG